MPHIRCLPMSDPTTRDTGNWGELMAADYLRRQARFLILEQQWRHQHGEIDLICREGKVLVFVEVRLRTSEPDPTATFFSIRKTKWRSLRRTAVAYLRQCNWPPAAARFDVIGIRRFSDGSIQDVQHWRNVGTFGSSFRY